MAPPLRVIPNLDLERELQTIDKFLRDGHYRQVGQLCGVILESALKETYRQILLEAPPETRKILGDLETKLGQGKTDYRSFELGKLVGLFREGNLFALGQKPLAIDCRISKDRLAKLVDWRNACAHPDHPVPSVAELNSFYWDLILLLQGLHFIPPRAAPPEAVRQSQEGPRHVAPGSLSLGDLAVWEEALGRGRLDMSLDCRQDGYLRDLQRILKEVLARSGYT